MQIKMKMIILVAVCAQLLLFAGVHSVPLSTSEEEPKVTQTISEGANLLEGVTTDDQDTQNFDEGGEPTPTEAYLEEIQEQVEAPRTEDEEEPLMRDTRSTCTYSAINQGNNVAFQSYHRGKWFSCAPNPCSSRHTCPGFSIGGTEWTNCWGEVFQFYRARGQGAVRVGDVVGVYYPYEAGKWLGCSGGNCVKATCPGTPSTTYGFQSQDKWTLCPGEVFKIYAQGKTVGSIINEHDIIMLYYVVGSQWVDLANTNIARGSGPGTTRPPSASTYESQSTYTLEIWKQ